MSGLERSAPWGVPALVMALLFPAGCASRRGPGVFRVLPESPDYLLRSPDSVRTPFREVPEKYTGVGPGWVELRPRMTLRMENAYFKDNAAQHTLANFLGTEIARYRVRSNGALRRTALQPLTPRPAGQTPVEALLQSRQMRFAYHRYFYQVLVSRSGKRSAILLNAASAKDMARIAAQLARDPESVCGAESAHCTVFPEACSVTLDIEIVVNGVPRTVLWASSVATVAARPRSLSLMRLHAGRLLAVEIDARDPNALRLPLLPGDRLDWQ
ncbi:MAG: hypothetical protein EXQ52_10910 [Bryobacterales bacterium]|nr:hypothetical protein [Bryobacterales bacterium]